MRHGLTLAVLLATLLGAGFGLACHDLVHDHGTLDAITNGLDLVAGIFLRAIRMIIAPLVFATLVSGVGRIRQSGTLGRIAILAMVWFVLASLAAMVVALAGAKLFAPGAGMHLHVKVAAGPSVVVPPTIAGFVANLVPSSIVEAMANNAILQIVVFALVAGVTIGRMGAAGENLLALAESLSLLMLRMTGYVMLLAPIGVFAAVAGALATQGFEIVLKYAAYIGTFYVVLAAIWLIMLLAAAIALGRAHLIQLLGVLRQPALIAFVTASSESVYPLLLARLESIGIPNRIAGLVLPLGYSFNLVGSMCYCTFAVLFVS